MKRKSKNPIVSGMGPEQNKFMKPGFSAGLVVALVFSGSSFETHSEGWPVLQAARISDWPSVSTLSDAQICNNLGEPKAMVVAAREIAQAAGVPATARRPFTASTTPVASAAFATSTGRSETSVASEGVVLAATSPSRNAGKTTKAKAETGALKMPPVLFGREEDGGVRILQMVVSENGVPVDKVEMAETLAKDGNSQVPARELVELIHEAAKNVVWVEGKSGRGTGFIVKHGPIAERYEIPKNPKIQGGCYVVTAQHVVAERIEGAGKHADVIDNRKPLKGGEVTMSLGGRRGMKGKILGCGAEALDGATGVVSSQDYCVVKLERSIKGVDGLNMKMVPPDELTRARGMYQMFTLGFSAAYNPDGVGTRVMTAAPVCDVKEGFGDLIDGYGAVTSCLVGFGESGGPAVGVSRNANGGYDISAVGLNHAFYTRREISMFRKNAKLKPNAASSSEEERLRGPSLINSPNTLNSGLHDQNRLDYEFVSPLGERSEDGSVGGMLIGIEGIIADDLYNPNASKCLPGN